MTLSHRVAHDIPTGNQQTYTYCQINYLGGKTSRGGRCIQHQTAPNRNRVYRGERNG